MAAPDFASHIDPTAFSVPGTQALQTGLASQDTADNNLAFDWSGVNSTLNSLAPEQAQQNALANGQGLTAGTVARMGQQNFADVAGDPQALGKALMQLGSKASATQAGVAAGANEQQQIQAARQATSLQQATEQARQHIYQSELQLQNQKFQMGQAVKKGQDGLQLANLQMQNMFNSLVSQAKNATDLGNIALQRDQFNQAMMYVGGAMSAASGAAAIGADYSTKQADPITGAASSASASDKSLASMYNSDSEGRVSAATSLYKV